MTGVNPRVLQWARTRAGLSIYDVALALKRTEAEVIAWEAGDGAPTFAQLDKLAYTLYKRPLAVFYFPEPPDEPTPSSEFRTLPDFEISALSSDTLYAVRQAEAMQLALKELNDGRNPSARRLFDDLKTDTNFAPTELALRARHYLGIDLDQQSKWLNTSDAFKHWRQSVEDCGVFVFKRSFKQSQISGFCLVDAEFPVIYINNSTPASRQCFTLFHELGHILLNASGVTKTDDRYIDTLMGSNRDIEVQANKFASELLVPSRDFDAMIGPNASDDFFIEKAARKYNVSREVILRKLLDRDMVSEDEYRVRVNEWNKQHAAERKSKKSGGNYYATQATYLGGKYLQLAFSRYYQGKCGVEQLADYLNVKVRSIPSLEQYALRGRGL